MREEGRVDEGGREGGRKGGRDGKFLYIPEVQYRVEDGRCTVMEWLDDHTEP